MRFNKLKIEVDDTATYYVKIYFYKSIIVLLYKIVNNEFVFVSQEAKRVYQAVSI